jgi:hypothetical protein
MRPERVKLNKYQKHGIVIERNLKIIFNMCPLYRRRVYRRTLHPSYIPWVQAVFHPVIGRYLGTLA